MRLLGDHGRRRLQGPVRFGQDVIFKFEQRGDVASPVPLPSFTVSAYFRVPGPGAEPFTDRAAVDVATVLRAMLAYATGAPVLQAPALWGADSGQVQEAERLLADPTVGELTVDGNVLAVRMSELSVWTPVVRRCAGCKVGSSLMNRLSCRAASSRPW